MPASDVGRIIRPVALFVGAWVGGLLLLVGAILHPVVPGGWYPFLLLTALIPVPLRAVARGFAGVAYPSGPTRLFIIRPFWYAMFFLPLLAIAGGVGALLGLLAGAPGAGARVAVLVVAALLAVMAVVGYLHSRQLEVRRLEVRLPRLPSGFEGVRIVQISDLHVGPHTPARHLTRIAEAVRGAEADLIVITGDQVDDYAEDVPRFLEFFGDLTAPLGVAAIAGNHDIFAGWDAVAAQMADAGMHVLVNDAVCLERDGHRLWLAGTGDPTARMWHLGGGPHAAPDIHRTLARVPAEEPVIALAHNPALWPALAERGVDLTLSGHTHAGQFALPATGWSLASLFLDLAVGVYQQGDALLHINAGTNYWGIPFRLGTPPEVTVLTLRAGEAASITRH